MSTQNVNVARFARNVECDFFCDFQTLCKTDEKLSIQEIEMILEAANWAPTHAKNEPWRYAIIEGSKSIHGYFDFLESWYENHVDEISEEDLTRFKRKLYR